MYIDTNTPSAREFVKLVDLMVYLGSRRDTRSLRALTMDHEILKLEVQFCR